MSPTTPTEFYQMTMSPNCHRLVQISLDPLILGTSETCLSGLANEIRDILSDRQLGMVEVKWKLSCGKELTSQHAHLRQFCQSLAQSLGAILPETRNTDGRDLDPSPTIDITLNGNAEDSPILRHFTNPQLPWPLHTDRALHVDAGDFLMVCKLEEHHGTGGEIRLLHLDEWPNLNAFANHPMAAVPLRWKGDPQMAPVWQQASLRREPGVLAPVFEDHPHFGRTIRFTDERFRTPQSLAQHSYLAALTQELKSVADRLPTFVLPVGGIYIVNNRFVLHGRSGFIASSQFQRRLLRICGNLASDLSSP